jgi:hypothetical protein
VKFAPGYQPAATSRGADSIDGFAATAFYVRGGLFVRIND